LPPSIQADMTASARRLQLAALLEGSTLLMLVGIAMPLKYLAAYPIAVSVIGPIHGMAFLLYLWLLASVASGDGWHKRDIGIALLAALVPFGAFAHAIGMHRKAAERRATKRGAHQQVEHQQATQKQARRT
jgi:integral membrane protein